MAKRSGAKRGIWLQSGAKRGKAGQSGGLACKAAICKNIEKSAKTRKTSKLTKTHANALKSTKIQQIFKNSGKRTAIPTLAITVCFVGRFSFESHENREPPQKFGKQLRNIQIISDMLAGLEIGILVRAHLRDEDFSGFLQVCNEVCPSMPKYAQDLGILGHTWAYLGILHCKLAESPRSPRHAGEL